VHLDHGTREIALEALATGTFNSVMIDASHESFDENIRITSEIVQRAHDLGVAVEAELGVLSGVEDELEVGEESGRYTRPEEVELFVSRTGCDSLAVAVGTSHGAYKFSGNQSIQFGILEDIQQRLPRFPLVLHGGSAIQGEEIERINRSGGMLKTTSRGVSPEEIKKSLKFGICKVNIATDARVIWTRVHREHLNLHPEQLDPIYPGKIYMDELEKLYIGKFQLLNATSKLKDLQP
jgi:fructose-bisphosphate aldolase class II